MTHNLYKKNQIHIKSALALGRRAQCLSKEVKMGFLARLMWEKLLYQSKKTLFSKFVLKLTEFLILAVTQLMRRACGEIVTLRINFFRAIVSNLLFKIPPDFRGFIFPEFTCYFVTLKSRLLALGCKKNIRKIKILI